MKGKYGDRAERRREMEELKRRADKAEACCERLTGQLASVTESKDKAIASLRHELAAARLDASNGTSVQLRAAQEQITSLQRQVKEFTADRKRFQKRWDLLLNGVVELVRQTTPCTWREAWEWTTAKLLERDTVPFILADKRGDRFTGFGEKALVDRERAAGVRSAKDPFYALRMPVFEEADDSKVTP